MAAAALQATPVQAAQELRPEGFSLQDANLQAQHLARLDVGGIDPQVRPVALDLAVQEGALALVELSAQPADLALGDAAHVQGLEEVIHRAGGHAVHIGFLDNGGKYLLRSAPGLQELREVAALAQLRELQLDAAGTRVPVRSR